MAAYLLVFDASALAAAAPAFTAEACTCDCAKVSGAMTSHANQSHHLGPRAQVIMEAPSGHSSVAGLRPASALTEGI